MHTLLILIGISIFLSGFSLYLRQIFQRDRALAYVSLLLPPVSWFYLKNDWPRFKIAAYVQLLGLVVLCSGIMFLLSANNDIRTRPIIEINPAEEHPSSQLSENIGSTFRTRIGAASVRATDPLQGKLNGQEFIYQNAEYIGDVLHFSQIGGYYAQMDVLFLLKSHPLKEWSEFLISPNDENAPEIHVSWIEPGDSIPHTKIYRQGYSLDLQVEEFEENRLRARMELILPGANTSYLVGTFQAYLSHLRYVDGKIDTRWNSEETLRYIAKQYLKERYELRDLNVIKYGEGKFYNLFDTIPEAKISALASNSAGEQVALHFSFNKENEGWQVDPNRSDFTAAYEQDRETQTRKRERNVVQRTKPKPAPKPAPTANPVSTATDSNTLVKPEVEANQTQTAPSAENIANRKIITQSDLTNGEHSPVQNSVENNAPQSEGIQSQTLAQHTVNPNQASIAPENENNHANPGVPISAPTTAPEEKKQLSEEEKLILAREKQVQPFIGKMVTVTSQSGRVVHGVFKEIRKKKLVIESRVAAGKVEYFVALKELQNIEHYKQNTEQAPATSNKNLKASGGSPIASPE